MGSQDEGFQFNNNFEVHSNILWEKKKKKTRIDKFYENLKEQELQLPQKEG